MGGFFLCLGLCRSGKMCYNSDSKMKPREGIHPMALLHVDFFSDVLGMCTNMDVILPETTVGQIGMEGHGSDGKCPTLYLLHGMSDDHTIWQRRTSIERYAGNTRDYYIDDVPLAVIEDKRRIAELKRKISGLGTPNLGAIEEFDRVNERYEYLTSQRDDVLGAKKDLEDIIRSITREMTCIFTGEFARINEHFGATFTEMFGGGRASLELEDPEQPLDCGIEIRVQPPGKQLKTITLLSGGEKAFVAIALYFAILKVRPTPFCMLDEIDAALDDRNVERFASYLRSLSKMTQFIVVTHRRGTMEEADTLYGVTMQEQGVSKMLHLDMNQMVEQLGITE